MGGLALFRQPLRVLLEQGAHTLRALQPAEVREALGAIPGFDLACIEADLARAVDAGWDADRMLGPALADAEILDEQRRELLGRIDAWFSELKAHVALLVTTKDPAAAASAKTLRGAFQRGRARYKAGRYGPAMDTLIRLHSALRTGCSSLPRARSWLAEASRLQCEADELALRAAVVDATFDERRVAAEARRQDLQDLLTRIRAAWVVVRRGRPTLPDMPVTIVEQAQAARRRRRRANAAPQASPPTPLAPANVTEPELV